MLSAVWSWIVKLVGWTVLLGSLGLGCASKGKVCLDWDMAIAEDVRQLDDGDSE